MMHIHRTQTQIAADRQRYEDHQRRGLNFAPKALPTPSPRPAPEIPADQIIAQETIPGGWYTAMTLKQGETLRLAPQSKTSVALAVWAAHDPTERMNLPDTIKVQWTTELTKGRVIFSDMGRVMLSFTEDSCGAHDALSGGSNAQTVGDPTKRNTCDNLILAAAKLGLDRRDIPAILSLFAPVRVDAAGKFEWRPAMLSGDDWVELRAEMDLKIALSNCPHPLDPLQTAGPLTLTRLHPQPIPPDDLCRTATAEAIRGFENNARV